MSKEWEKDDTFSTILGDIKGGQKTGSALAALQKRMDINKSCRCLIICILSQEKHWLNDMISLTNIPKHKTFHFHRMDQKKIEKYEILNPPIVFVSISTMAQEYTRCASYYAEYNKEEIKLSNHGPLLTATQRLQSLLYSCRWDLVLIDDPVFLAPPFWEGCKKMPVVVNNLYKVSHPQSRSCYNLDYQSCILLNADLFRNRITDPAGHLYMCRINHPCMNGDWWADEDKESFKTRVRNLVRKYVYVSMTRPKLETVIEHHTKNFQPSLLKMLY